MIFKNFGQKVLALIAALALWVFLMSVQNAVYQVPEKIDIQTKNISELYSVKEDLPGVVIKINSTPEKIQKVSAKDFTAYIDLNGLSEGEHEVKVKVETNLSDVTILKIEPETINVSLEVAKEKELPIVLDVQGKPAIGYEVINSYPLENKLIVRGGSNLANAVQVKAVLNLTGTETEKVERDVELVVVNNVGEVLENLKLYSEEMTVIVEISKAKTTKTVNVEPKITDVIKDLFKGKIQVVPSQVVVRGSEDVLKLLSSIETEEIKDEEVKEGAKFNKNLVLPEGVELKENETSTVIINVF